MGSGWEVVGGVGGVWRGCEGGWWGEVGRREEGGGGGGCVPCTGRTVLVVSYAVGMFGCCGGDMHGSLEAGHARWLRRGGRARGSGVVVRERGPVENRVRVAPHGRA